jgi:uncharacterized alkaline shock family protein YloU
MSDLDLSRELTAVVAAVDGVIGVYGAGPLHRSVGLAIANATSAGDPPAKVSLTRERDGKLRVEVAIGVLSAVPVPRTLRAVGDAVRAHLAARDEDAPLDVRVTVSHIETPAPTL